MSVGLSVSLSVGLSVEKNCKWLRIVKFGNNVKIKVVRIVAKTHKIFSQQTIRKNIGLQVQKFENSIICIQFQFFED